MYGDVPSTKCFMLNPNDVKYCCLHFLTNQKYGQLAAAEGLDTADLLGIVTWDLMHLNKNGFKFSPNGAGISGLVDPELFFNPVYTSEVGGGDDGLEPTLVNIVATQYVEVSV